MASNDSTESLFKESASMALPTAFQVYLPTPKQTKLLSNTSIYHIGAPDSPPVYTSKHDTTWKGKTTISLHPGSTPGNNPIASTESESWKNSNAMCTVSPLSPPEYSTDSKRRPEEPISERISMHCTLKHETWTFVFPITGLDGTTAAEKFEWRSSRGVETAGLRDGKATYGFKLVRLDSDNPTKLGGKRETRGEGESSDGREIVAVWSDDTSTWYRGLEKGVKGKFEFLGSGTGDLGERWRVMALMSALRMRQVRLQHARAAGAAAAA